MGAPNDYYVAASSGNDAGGSGTSGDPWRTLAYALNNLTHNAINGSRIYLSGTNTLTAALTFPATSAYAAHIWDNWVGGPDGDGIVDGGGSYYIVDIHSNLHFLNLKFQNLTNGSSMFKIDDNCWIINCEITNISGTAIETAPGAICPCVIGCYIYDVGQYGIYDAGFRGVFSNNYLANGGTYQFSDAIAIHQESSMVDRNIISIGGATDGIAISEDSVYVQHNSILSNGGTGNGIEIDAISLERILVFNNLVEGFSGAGGAGFSFSSINRKIQFEGNGVYNCTTAYENIGDAGVTLGDDNESLASSPFVKSGSNTFANRYIYFAPTVLGGAFLGNLDKGAVQGSANSIIINRPRRLI